MNILQYGQNSFFSEEWKESGHNVFLVGERKTCDIPLSSITSAKNLLEICRSKNFVPDVFLYADDSTLPHLFGIEQLEIPTVFYSIDTYCHAWHGNYSAAFDYVLYAQGEEKEEFSFHADRKDTEVSLEHFPLFASYFAEEETEEQWFANRDIPVSFVGTVGHKNNPDRYTFFTLFKNFEPIFITQGQFVPVFRRSKIILNQSAVGELNFRTFEAMAMGCACLADNMPTEKNGIADIFDFGQNSLPTYPRMDVAKAVDFCRHWLSKEKEHGLYEIARQGRALVYEKHSRKVRAKRLEEIFAQCLEKKSWLRRVMQLESRNPHIAKAFLFLSEQEQINEAFLSAYASICRKYGK